MKENLKVAGAIAATVIGLLNIIPFAKYALDGLAGWAAEYVDQIYIHLALGICLFAGGVTFLWTRSKWYRH